MIPHNRVITTSEDLEAVERVIRSGQLAQGPEVEALEAELCEFTGRKYAVCVASGLAALRVALSSRRDLTPTVPAYSCVALANAAYSWSEKLGVADVLPGKWTIDPFDLEPEEKEASVVAVNTFGVKADIGRIRTLSSFVPFIIEDCTHGFGDHISDVEVLSFYATKLIGGAEGGVLLTDSSYVAEYARDRRDYGDKPASGTRLNDKMSDVHAALVRTKLRRLPLLLEEREELAMLYLEELNPVRNKIELPSPGDQTWYRFVIGSQNGNVDHFIARLRARGVHAERPIEFWPDDVVPYPVSEKAMLSNVSLPLYPGLTKDEVRHVAAAVRELVA